MGDIEIPWDTNPLGRVAERAWGRGDSALRTLLRKYPDEKDRIRLPDTHAIMVENMRQAAKEGRGPELDDMCQRYLERMHAFCQKWEDTLNPKRKQWTKKY